MMGRVWRVITFLLCLLALGNCKRETTISGKGDTLVIVAGGLGADQTNDIVSALQTNPSLTVISASSWDAYTVNIAELYRANQKNTVILIGHSFGAEAVVKACHDIPRVHLLVLIDPVTEDWGDMEIPQNVDSTIVFYRSRTFGPKTAKIKEGPSITVVEVEGGHNDLPHNNAVIDQITMGVQ